MKLIELIDRRKLLNTLCKECGHCKNMEEAEQGSSKPCSVHRIISEQPTIESEPVRHGRWIKHGGGFVVTCSNCNSTYRKDALQSISPYAEHLTRHCPCCGARMDG